MSYYGTETATQCRHCGAPAEEGDTCAKCEELFHPRPKVERPLPPTAKVEDELDTKLTPTRSTMRAPVPGYKLLIAGFLIWVFGRLIGLGVHDVIGNALALALMIAGIVTGIFSIVRMITGTD